MARNTGRRRRPQQVRPIVVVPNTGGRSRNRRRRPRKPRRSGGVRNGGRSGNSETFVFNKDSIKDNSTGTLKFGPSLSESVALSGGVLKAYHEYKITSLRVTFKSESSSTAEGSIAYELDPHCKLSALASTLKKFSVSKGGTYTFKAAEINGVNWHDVADDQFFFHFKGNGTKGAVAGYFAFSYTVQLHNPK